MQPWQAIPINETLKENLRNMLRQKADIFSFQDDLHLSSLLACLGLLFEWKRKHWNRLAPIVTKEQVPEQNFQGEIISHNNQIGVRLWIDGVTELIPRHRDFSRILHPLSINENGTLENLIFFPYQVVNLLNKRNITAVIVKDWVLSSFLAQSHKKEINYQVTNENEIRQNIALTQTELMLNQSLPFFGTHDLVDHALGANGNAFANLRGILETTRSTLSDVKSNKELILSYFIGVLLDDMAQSRWYHSEKHLELLKRTTLSIRNAKKSSIDLPNLNLPTSFHSLVRNLRDESEMDDLISSHDLFIRDLEAMTVNKKELKTAQFSQLAS